MAGHSGEGGEAGADVSVGQGGNASGGNSAGGNGQLSEGGVNGESGARGEGGASDSAGGQADAGGASFAPGEEEAGAGGDGDGGGASTCHYTPQATCTGDLSHVGLADFEIVFTLQTTAIKGSGVVSQRAECGHSFFWDVRVGQGLLAAELDDGSGGYAACFGTTLVNDGNPHTVVLRRVSEKLSIYVDCQLDVTCDAKTNLSATLDTLQTKTDACTDPTKGDGTLALQGNLDPVCIGKL